MPDYTMDTNESAANDANVIRLSIANPAATPTPTVGALRLCANPFTPDVDTKKADLVAAEITLVGYPAGGYDVDEITPPVKAAGGGVAITTPSIPIAYASGAEATVSAWWLEDSGGLVRKVGVFDPPRTLAAALDGFTWVRQFVYGRNA